MKHITRTNDVFSVTGVCADSMTYMDQTAQITVKGKNEIIYSPTGDPGIDTDLRRCSP